MKNLINIGVLGLIIAISGCEGDGADKKKNNQDQTQVKTFDGKKNQIFQVGNELFSIPSPVQTAFFIKKTGAGYNREMLNDPASTSSYSTKVQLALNLGIYGADLGYVTLYDQTQDAIEYINSTKKIADNLGVSSAFNAELMERFKVNLGNQDSLLVLVSDAYRSADAFLKNNERDDVGSLILAGGWIEALYFSVNVAKDNPGEGVYYRIGEQKTSLENLIKLLQQYTNNEEYADLVDNLIDLYYAFDEVEYSYVYAKPTHNPEEQLTIINSKSEVEISEEQLENISEKIMNIRDQIVG